MKANERLSGLSFLVSFPLCAKGSEEEENGGRTSGITARRNVTACIIRDVCRSFSPMSNAPSKWLRLLTPLLRAAELDRAWSGDSGADSGSGADSSSSFSRPPLKPARKGSVRRQKRLQAPLAPMAASREAFFGPMRGIKADFPPLLLPFLSPFFYSGCLGSVVFFVCLRRSRSLEFQSTPLGVRRASANGMQAIWVGIGCGISACPSEIRHYHSVR